MCGCKSAAHVYTMRLRCIDMPDRAPDAKIEWR